MIDSRGDRNGIAPQIGHQIPGHFSRKPFKISGKPARAGAKIRFHD
jgi:hypothetical protein